jgi:hypothetical protein
MVDAVRGTTVEPPGMIRLQARHRSASTMSVKQRCKLSISCSYAYCNEATASYLPAVTGW